MYCMNNIMIVSHKGLYLIIDLGFLVSFVMSQFWGIVNYTRRSRTFYTHTSKNFKYLLGDPNHKGKNMFIIWQMRRNEFPTSFDDHELQTLNQMHASYNVHEEWGSVGLKKMASTYEGVWLYQVEVQ